MAKSIYLDFKKLKKDMEGMSTLDKIDHFFTYYKEILLVVAVALTVVFGLVFSLISGMVTSTEFHGIFSNQTISDIGNRYITKEFHEYLGFNKNQKVTVGAHEYDGTITQEQVQSSWSQMMAVLAKVEAKTLDYMFMTEETFELFVSEDFYMDLREIFSDEELEAFGQENIRYATWGDVDEMYPIAINVTNMPFVQKHIYSGEDVWFSFVANTKRPETCRVFWDYLNAWTPEHDPKQ